MSAPGEAPHYRGIELDERFIPTVLEHLDQWTRMHSRASAEWAERIGREMGLDDGRIRVLRLAALLHAIDRLGVPPEEYDICRVTQAEEEALRRSPAILGRLVPREALDEVVDAVVASRERWDGSGRPRGLRGEAIPLLGRIVAAACGLLSLTMKREGREPMSRSEALKRLQREAGRLYCPDVVAALTRAVTLLEGKAEGG